MKTHKVFLIACAMTLLGCPAGDDTDTGVSTGGDDDGATTPDDSATSTSTAGDDDDDDSADTTAGGDDDGTMEGGSVPDGSPCTSNSECMSLLCPLFTDVEENKDAVCEPAPAGGNTRITGTVFDFSTGSPVGGAGLVVTSALNAAADPLNAMAIIEATASGSGQVDTTSEMPINAQIGIVALTSAGGYYLTATGLASPGDGGAYGPGNGIHDLWVVPTADLTAWSDALADDADIDADMYLPLGDRGGVVGMVRSITNGEPIAGATVEPDDGTTSAIIRYLGEDGTFNSDATGPSGVFLIIDPDLAERFEAHMGGAAISGTGTAGSTNNAVFTMILSVAG